MSDTKTKITMAVAPSAMDAIATLNTQVAGFGGLFDHYLGRIDEGNFEDLIRKSTPVVEEEGFSHVRDLPMTQAVAMSPMGPIMFVLRVVVGPVEETAQVLVLDVQINPVEIDLKLINGDDDEG